MQTTSSPTSNSSARCPAFKSRRAYQRLAIGPTLRFPGPVASKKLTDGQAKDILRRWPRRGDKLWASPTGSGFWMRAQPRDLGEAGPTPTIRLPGATLFKTQPDGMWVFVDSAHFADVVCIEVCGTNQNLNDKRSRYSAAVRSLVLHLPLKWLLAEVAIQGRGTKTRWEAMRTLPHKPVADAVVPIRYARVLYALPNSLYLDWSREGVAGGHEYFCRHSSLDSYSSQKMQEFLRRLSTASHFLTTPGR